MYINILIVLGILNHLVFIIDLGFLFVVLFPLILKLIKRVEKHLNFYDSLKGLPLKFKPILLICIAPSNDLSFIHIFFKYRIVR